MKRLYFNDILLCIAIVSLCVILPFVLTSNSKDNLYAVVSHEGKRVYEIPLDDKKTVEAGGVTIEVKDGSAYVKSSTCPDGLCIGMGQISKNGSSIICVPNKVSVKITDDMEGEIVVAA